MIVSGILSAGGAARALLEAARVNRFTIVTSPVLLEELEEVLERFFPRMAAVEARVAYEEQAEVFTPELVAAISRDPDDDHVIAAAAAGGAVWIVTRDLDLLSLGAHDGIKMVEPAPFLRKVRSAQALR